MTGLARKTFQERAAEGVYALWERRAFTQAQLADRIKRPKSIANRIIHGQQPVTLDVLEAVGELAGVNPLELLIDPSDELKMVNPLEAQLLRFFRAWPQPTKLALVTFASFFADEDPATADLRRAHEQLRRLPDGKQRLALAYLTFLTEGDLAPDIRKGLGLPETDEPQSPQRTRRRTRTP